MGELLAQGVQSQNANIPAIDSDHFRRIAAQADQSAEQTGFA